MKGVRGQYAVRSRLRKRCLFPVSAVHCHLAAGARKLGLTGDKTEVGAGQIFIGPNGRAEARLDEEKTLLL